MKEDESSRDKSGSEHSSLSPLDSVIDFSLTNIYRSLISPLHRSVFTASDLAARNKRANTNGSESKSKALDSAHMEGSTAGPSRSALPSQAPQPGDGAYLAASQPGDGRYLQNPNRQATRGRGRGRGGGRDGGARRADGQRGDQPRGAMSHGTTTGGHAALNGELSQGLHGLSLRDESGHESQRSQHANGPGNTARGGPGDRPKRPQKARNFDPLLSDPTSGSAVNGHLESSSNSAAPSRSASAQPKSRRNKGGARSNGQPARPNESNVLDPGAQSFIPTQPSSPNATTSAFSTRPSSPTQDGSVYGQSKRKNKGKPRKENPNGNTNDRNGNDSAFKQTPVKSSRRAAFEQQTKLTTSGGKADTGREAADSLAPDKGNKVDAEVRGKGRSKEEKDDLVSRLTRGLKSRPYLECPIVSLIQSERPKA